MAVPILGTQMAVQWLCRRGGRVRSARSGLCLVSPASLGSHSDSHAQATQRLPRSLTVSSPGAKLGTLFTTSAFREEPLMIKRAVVESTAEAYLELLAARGVEYLFANAGTDFAP